MSPIQQMLLGAGAVATKTYVDDVFSTYVYAGNSTARSINNGIDLSGEGGMLWVKRRNQSEEHIITDTVRGAANYIASSNADGSNSGSGISSFNSTGFSLGTVNHVNGSGHTYASWTFRKAPGFFDVVTWTGNGNGSRQISHSLESVPGCIMIKRTDGSYGWYVYHRGLDSSNPERYYLRLNETDASQNTTGQQWMAAAPTSTNFTLAADIGGSGYEGLNTNGQTYVAYVFAGGESTQNEAVSVDFDGSGDYLSLASSSDFDFGTDDYTIECWINIDAAGYNGLWTAGGSYNSGVSLVVDSNGKFALYDGAYLIESANNVVSLGQWYHVAVSRSSNTVKLFVNGAEIGSATQSSIPQGAFYVGAEVASNGSASDIDGKISNFRVVKGTAVYTSSFRPPTEPLTNITNTKLLCCNNSSTTGSTVTPGTITANGDPTASSDSPFDDPAAHVFGVSGSESVIKCGSYVGTGSAGIEVNIGFEPQLILVKSTASGENWEIYDSMRGIVDGLNQSDRRLRPNTSDAEDDNPGFFSLRPNGFIVNGTSGSVNQNGVTFVFLAIRRPDGYVGKPPELGTDVFAMDTLQGSNPNFVSNFPVDFATLKLPDGAQGWYTGARLIQGKNLMIDETSAETTESSQQYDYQNGYYESLSGSYQAWMWKRHAGFDVVTYEGNGVQGRDIPHSLGVAPNMMWVKNRTRTAGGGADWNVYVSGITHLSVYGSDPDNRGNNPVSLKLNDTDDAQFSGSGNWDHTHPTSTHFRVGDTYTTNQSGEQMIAFLFASVDGISKVGSYDGSSSTVTVTTGFQPRFVIIKKTNDHNDWYVLDTTRGWGSGVDPNLRLNDTVAQNSDDDFGAPTSNGFTLTGNMGQVNVSGDSFIYYAHA
jgi:hypothetical protein